MESAKVPGAARRAARLRSDGHLISKVGRRWARRRKKTGQ